jgi:hypothetical protein
MKTSSTTWYAAFGAGPRKGTRAPVGAARRMRAPSGIRVPDGSGRGGVVPNGILLKEGET